MSYYKKPKIPYEMKNAREWDPHKTLRDVSSSEDEDDREPEDGYGDEILPPSHQQQFQTSTSLVSLDDDDGFQPVIRRFQRPHTNRENADKTRGSKARRENSKGSITSKETTLSIFNSKPQSAENNRTVATRTIPSKILHNRLGQRIDPIIQCDPNEVERVQKLRLCNWQFLSDECLNRETCTYDHDFKPTKHELQTLTYVSRLAQCNYGTECNNAKCIYGHADPNDLNVQKGRNFQTKGKAPIKTLKSRVPPIINHQIPINNPTTDEYRSPPGPSRNDQTPSPQLMFPFDRDNSARTAFRQRENSAGKFHLHKRIIEIEPDPSRLETFLIELGIRIGSFVRPPQTAQDRELMIWGNPRQVSQTLGELRNWILRSEGLIARRALSKENFAHEVSTINTKYKDIQRKMLKKAEIDRFQQIPDPHQLFEYQGAYLWPVEDVKPQDIFGPNLEAFDQMRFILKSHIVFDDKLQSFRIYTDSNRSVAKALKLIEGTLKEYHARNACNGRPSSVLLVDPLERKTSGKSVRMQSWSSSVEPSEHHVPALTGDMLDPKARMEWESQKREIITSNAIKIQEALQLALPYMKFYRGQVSMKILFGTFVLTLFKWPKEKPASIPFEDFLRNMMGNGTKGKIIRDLRLNRDASEILSEIYSLKGIFKPLDSTTETLSEVARTYGARFEINRFERPAMQLEVEMHNSASEKELFEKTHSVWTRLDRKDNSVPVELFMLRLGGGASWKLQVSTENQLDKWRIDQQMADFADSVKMKASKIGAELDGRKIFNWETTSVGYLKPSVFEQKIALRYRLAFAQEFIFEVARYDSYDLSINAQMPSTTHWGASMWNSDWDLNLSKNAGLGLGECADWDSRLQEFFPNPEPFNSKNGSHEVQPGLKWFLQNVQMVTESLDRIKNLSHLRS